MEDALFNSQLFIYLNVFHLELLQETGSSVYLFAQQDTYSEMNLANSRAVRLCRTSDSMPVLSKEPL